MGGGDGTKNADGRLNHGGAWRAEPDWPIARTRRWQLHLNRDGALTEESPDTQGLPLTYTFDPENPVPSLGGNMASFSALPKPEDGGPEFDEIPPFGERAAAVLPHVISTVPTGPMHQRERPGLVALPAAVAPARRPARRVGVPDAPARGGRRGNRVQSQFACGSRHRPPIPTSRPSCSTSIRPMTTTPMGIT